MPILFILFFLSMPAWAATELEQAVAKDIMGLIDDTVNEGEQTSTLIHKNGEPQVRCTISNQRSNPRLRWPFVGWSLKWNLKINQTFVNANYSMLSIPRK